MSHILTFEGRMVPLLEIQPEHISIGDIAHGLSMLCRFGGQVRDFYSVAQHCFHVSRLQTSPEAALWGLLHDATEAYLGDVIGPLKRHLPEYEGIEERAMIAVCDRFGLPYEMPESVRVADEVLLKTEARDLCHNDEWLQGNGVAPLEERIVPMSQMNAKVTFLSTFSAIMRIRRDLL